MAQSAALHWHGQLTPTPRTHQHNYAVWSDQLGGQFQTTYRGYSEMKGSLKNTWARLGSATYCHHQRPPYEKGNDMDRPYKSWDATIFHAQSDSVLGGRTGSLFAFRSLLPSRDTYDHQKNDVFFEPLSCPASFFVTLFRTQGPTPSNVIREELGVWSSASPPHDVIQSPPDSQTRYGRQDTTCLSS